MLRHLAESKVNTTVSDKCECGMFAPGPNGEPTPAKKSTKWAYSSPKMLKRLSTRCSGTPVHQQLVGGRETSAEDYPLELITEILRGMRDTADHEEQWGDEADRDLDATMLSAGRLHDPKFSNIVAAYRAKDSEEEARRLSVKYKHNRWSS